MENIFIAEWLRGAPKSPSNVTSTFFYRVHLLPKDRWFEHVGAKLAFCPRRHLTEFRPCYYESLQTSLKTPPMLLIWWWICLILRPANTGENHWPISNFKLRISAITTVTSKKAKFAQEDYFFLKFMWCKPVVLNRRSADRYRSAKQPRFVCTTFLQV